ncbi:MAG: hypothetical protein J6M18_06815 [Actinomycetaceae bacterium]|nr:hypothetical protein [Actinomycetaceae bacterium]
MNWNKRAIIFYIITFFLFTLALDTAYESGWTDWKAVKIFSLYTFFSTIIIIKKRHEEKAHK